MVRYSQEAHQRSNRSACTTSCPCQETLSLLAVDHRRPSLGFVSSLSLDVSPLGPFINNITKWLGWRVCMRMNRRLLRAASFTHCLFNLGEFFFWRKENAFEINHVGSIIVHLIGARFKFQRAVKRKKIDEKSSSSAKKKNFFRAPLFNFQFKQKNCVALQWMTSHLKPPRIPSQKKMWCCPTYPLCPFIPWLTFWHPAHALEKGWINF